MNIKSSILNYSTTAEGKNIASQIVKQPELFDELIQCFFMDDIRVVQRSANVINVCVEEQPALIYPYLDKIIDMLEMDTQNTVKRNILRMLQFIEVPEKYFDKVADISFQCLESVKEPVANRVFAMTVLFQIVTKIPELKEELRMMIEDHMPYGSAGFKSRGKKILAKLQKL